MSLLRLNHARLAVLKPEHVLTIPVTSLVELKQSMVVNTPPITFFPLTYPKRRMLHSAGSGELLRTVTGTKRWWKSGSCSVTFLINQCQKPAAI